MASGSKRKVRDHNFQSLFQESSEHDVSRNHLSMSCTRQLSASLGKKKSGIWYRLP